MFYPVIMAGGTGTRLWPMSRRAFPKQALELIDNRTLIQHAVERLTPEYPPNKIYILTAEEHVQQLSRQVPEIPLANYIIEPLGRGTGPAIGLAAVHLRRRDPQAIMAVLAADHYIENAAGFRHALKAAAKVAAKSYIVTLGIKPSFPSIGYGYIQQGQKIGTADGLNVFQAEKFTEKPAIEAARAMVNSADFSWNSGMFVWQVAQILDEFARQMPEFFVQLQEVEKSLGQSDYQSTLVQIWPNVKKETIDYGIMEGAKNVAVIPVDIGWSDVGSWVSLEQVVPKDKNGNIILGNYLGIDTKDSIFVGQKRLIATIGVENLIIVDTEDALLVCSKEREQDVRDMVKLLEEKGREDLL